MSVTDDRFGARTARHGPPALRPFVDAGVLETADVHLAATLCRLGAVDGADVALAIALACRAVRHGSVTVDLATIAESVTVEDGPDDLTALPWPEPGAWVDAMASCPLVAVGDDAHTDRGAAIRPVRLLGSSVALDRYWRHERAIAAAVLTRAVGDAETLEPDGADASTDVLERLFGPSHDDAQRRATQTAISRRIAVVAGGPGTGKTTTIATILAALFATGSPRVALAAPTGKAAARVSEAIHDSARSLRAQGRIDDDVADAVLATSASTLHRLLGRRPGSNSRFRHDATNRLPHDVVIVDETSMVSLSMMSHLLAAVADDAHLVLVGDPQQLASVEAGAVLGDIVAAAEPGTRLADHVVVLDRVHRFGGRVNELASAVVSGDADAGLAVLRSGASDVEWVDVDVATVAGHAVAVDALRGPVVTTASAVVDAARRGDAAGALASMGSTQLLCAHRRGPYGVSVWRREVERWLTEEIPGYSPYDWYAGRPLLMTENDYALGLFNGDTGVTVASHDGALVCAFERRGEIVEVSPRRLRAVETLYAMTIHKSQGSQFAHPIVVLPDDASPILTRELLYTAVTRASERVTVVGTEAAVRAAIERPVQRASGLRDRLV